MKKGYFFAIEGPDGAGKTTVVRKLYEALKKEGRHVVYTREPGGTNCELAEKIRDFILQNKKLIDNYTEAFLFAAARREHVTQFIRPSLKLNKIVISDRFLDSSLAYQGLNQKETTVKIKKINEMALDGVAPDKTFLLFLDYKIGLERIRQKRNNSINRYDKKPSKYYENVSSAFKNLADEDPKQYQIIDASQNEENLFQDVYKRIKKIIND